MLGKLSVREKNLIIILFIVVLFGAVYFQFFKLLGPKYCALRNELRIKGHELESTKEMINNFEQLKKENEVLKQRMALAQTKYNNDITNGLSYYFIGKHAEEHLVTVITMVPQPVEVKGKFLVIPVSISAQGKYQDIQRFIQALEAKMPNTTEIVFLLMEPKGPDESKDQTEQVGEEVNFNKDKAFIEGKDPDILVSMKLITYLTRSSKSMELGEDWMLGRGDAFSPMINTADSVYGVSTDHETSDNYLQPVEKVIGDSKLLDEITEENEFPVGDIVVSTSDDNQQALDYCFPQGK
ncbi:MAG: type 4a pilus biogenesis protein PilO [Desulfitobacteriaceae bacterium]|nr:type 4a pilus biogenesis protein PilO [Desulfitobacteriaceae bacterium]